MSLLPPQLPCTLGQVHLTPREKEVGNLLGLGHSVKEIAGLRAQGVTISRENLRIAENAPLILSLHGELDALRENSAAEGARIGTTKRGIGPAYEDQVGRRAIRVMDLADLSTLDAKNGGSLS